MSIPERIQELRRTWAEETGDDPSNYLLTRDDWSVGLGDEEADELVTLLDIVGTVENGLRRAVNPQSWPEDRYRDEAEGLLWWLHREGYRIVKDDE